jgi:hypothetical protein
MIVPSPKNPSVRPEASIASAAAKTRSAIEGLQEKLSVDAQTSVPRYVAPVPRIALDLAPSETDEDLERQLQSYFARASSAPKAGANISSSKRTQILDELRSRVIDGVAERILTEWACPQPGTSPTLGSELMERLIERLLEQLRKPAEMSKIELTM